MLTEAEGYSFETGRADITPQFGAALKAKIIPNLKVLTRRYECNTIEVIGHTDGQLVASKSNLDVNLTRVVHGGAFALTPGSNTDLGLMRAWTVVRYLQEIGDFQGMIFYGYSAGQVIHPNGSYAVPHDGPVDAARRRIELRVRRSPIRN
jgi:flagellar motor protein MotB